MIDSVGRDAAGEHSHGNGTQPDAPAKAHQSADADSSEATAHADPEATDPSCGTMVGWSNHRARGEKICRACRQARNEYDTIRRRDPKVKARTRAFETAFRLASAQLRSRHAEEWRRLYDAERDRQLAALDQSAQSAHDTPERTGVDSADNE